MNDTQTEMERLMDLNELYRRHQMALIAVGENEVPEKRAHAEREADRFAAQIKALRSHGAAHRTVLSSRTFSELSGS